MEQRNSKLEIVLELLKSENHVRGIARNINVSHTTVLRNLKDLASEGVVDFRRKGKNKVFYLKNNLISKNYIYMAEHHKCNLLVSKYPKMKIILSDILKESKDRIIILFGSYAKFKGDLKSDIDILIESEDGSLKNRLREIDRRINLKIGKFDKDSHLGREILENHMILREVGEFYEKNKVL